MMSETLVAGAVGCCRVTNGCNAYTQEFPAQVDNADISQMMLKSWKIFINLKNDEYIQRMKRK